MRPGIASLEVQAAQPDRAREAAHPDLEDRELGASVLVDPYKEAHQEASRAAMTVIEVGLRAGRPGEVSARPRTRSRAGDETATAIGNAKNSAKKTSTTNIEITCDSFPNRRSSLD